jgi:hypothetical protein
VRCFRTANESLYESIRLQLDAAWGHPNPQTKTITCFDPAAVAPRDKQGRLLLAVNDAFTEMEPAATLLPQLIASGAVEEITEAEYQAAIAPPLQG